MATEHVVKQRLYDRSRPDYTQAKGHNQRVKKVYPEIWAVSELTNESLADWIGANKRVPCIYCEDGKGQEVDHIVPLSKNGKHEIENLQMICMECNRSKHDMTDEEFRTWREKNPVIKTGLTLKDYGIDYRVLKDKMGRYRTKSLFKEMWNQMGANPDLKAVFVLKGDVDRDGLISLKRIYLEIGDPTEYRFAKTVFHDYRHWGFLSKRSWMAPFIKEWRNELKAKIRSAAIDAMITMSSDNLAALKSIATEDFVYVSFIDQENYKKSGNRGRPMKDRPVEVIPEATFEADASRMGLNG